MESISTFLAKQYDELNGFDFGHQDEVQKVYLDLQVEDAYRPREQRIQNLIWAGDYASSQMDPWARFDDAEPLEEEAPSLTIGQIDRQEQEESVSAMRDRAYDSIKSYRDDAFYTKQIPSDAEAQVDYLRKE